MLILTIAQEDGTVKDQIKIHINNWYRIRRMFEDNNNFMDCDGCGEWFLETLHWEEDKNESGPNLYCPTCWKKKNGTV